MSWRIYLILALLGLAISLGVAQLQQFPGYLDSDYYFAGGIQLVQGKGFTEPYLWNYLDNPQGLPHPAYGYWMPLASLVAALGMFIAHNTTYAAGRLGFILVAALVPVVTSALAFSFSKRVGPAVVSGLLAVFSIYDAPFMPVPDNFGIFMLLGGLYLLISANRKPIVYFFLGLLSGLLMLARSDGLLWFGLTFLLILWRFFSDKKSIAVLVNLLLALTGFILVMGPWFWRNYQIYGAILAPGGSYLFWLRSYDETFIYPASQLTMQSWLAQGLDKIVSARVSSLTLNLLNAFAAQGGIFLFPFILIGVWQHRKDDKVRISALGWLALLFVMTLIFPFAGARGGFFHAGAAMQPMWWTLAPLGLEAVISAIRSRGWLTADAFKVFNASLVGIAILMTAVIIFIRIIRPGWGEGEQKYPQIEALLRQDGIQASDVVIVRNPPGYYLMTGRSAVVVPFGDEQAVLAVAERYHARFLILEAQGSAGPIKSVYDNLQSQRLHFLSEIGDTRVFEIQP